MNLSTIKSTIKNAFNARFGAGSFDAQLGSRQDGVLPLAEAAALALVPQAPTTPPQPQTAAPVTAQQAAAPTGTPGTAADAQALFSRIDALTSDLSTARATIAGLQDSKLKLEAQLSVCKTKIATFDNQMADASAREAARIVANIGFKAPIAMAPEPSGPGNGQSALEQFNAIRDARERAKFYADHKAQLLFVQ